MADKEGKALGAKIRRFREQADLSQSQLGEKLGVSYQQVQKYERGASRLGVDTLLRLAKALNQPVGAFLPPHAGEGAPEGKERVAEARPEYAPGTREEKELLKSFRDIADDRLRAAFLATLKAAAAKSR
jgi:transcriptional regulator with XRE-family HTH domain